MNFTQRRQDAKFYQDYNIGTVQSLREILHQYIDEADEDKLEAIYTLVKEENT